MVFENDGEYHTENVECGPDSADPDDPGRGTAEGVFEFDDGEGFSVELIGIIVAIRISSAYVPPTSLDSRSRKYELLR